MPHNQFSAECPTCSSRLKRLPATRRDTTHVYCMDCGHDFGRYEHVVERYRQELESLEAKLKATPAAASESAQSSAGHA